MKNLNLPSKIRFITLLFISSWIIVSCEDDIYEDPMVTNEENQTNEDVIKKQLKAAGFYVDEGFRKFEDGYIVENDIYLTAQEINDLSGKGNNSNRQKQYRTNSIVMGIRFIDVFMDQGFDQYMQDAFDDALARFNNQNLRLIFRRSTNRNSSNIKILSFFENSQTLGFSGGFPKNGDPANTIRLNTKFYNDNTRRPDATTVIAHEIGHAIGFRHTDYANRSYSCSGAPINEGAGSSGANHIAGTPLGPSPNSWMLACSSNTDRPFTSSDISALKSMYSLNRAIRPWINNYTQNNGGWRTNLHERRVADVNGDGKSDIIGFGQKHVFVSLSNGAGFLPQEVWISNYTQDNGGWRTNLHERRVADVNGDGKADIVGFGQKHVFVSLSNGTSFLPLKVWISDYTQDTGGWRTNLHVRRVADVNGDGRADIVGFGQKHVFVSLSTGSSFTPAKSWITEYTQDSGGWRTNLHERRVADVNGDGKADIVGFGQNAVYVSLSTGSRFGPQRIWKQEYAQNAGGWRIDKHPRHVADINGDGKADVVGFGTNEVIFSLSNGNSFGPQKSWIVEYAYNFGGWRVDKHPRMLSDVNNDQRADIIGFGNNQVLVSKSDF